MIQKTFEEMEMLEKIFYMQNLFDTDLATNRNLEFTKEQWIQKEVLAMISELAELLDEVNFKWWKNPKPENSDNIKDEIVDILHFFTAMCIKSGMSATELYERYMKKNQENFDRQYGKSDKKGYELK
ncbi:MAG: dUTPase [Clostridia bacterium]